MADDATLADALVTEPEAKPATTTETKVETKPAEPQITDAEASEIGRIMLQSGYTKDKINTVLQAPQALDALKFTIENDPEGFLRMLEQANPKAGEKFHEVMADVYVKRYGADGKPAAAAADKNAPLMAEVAALREELNSVKTERQSERNAAAMASIKSRYDARVEDLFGQIPTEISLSKSEKAGMRALLDRELSTDPSIVQRVSNGNFVDVAPTFKKVIDNWSADRKALVEAEKTAREKSSANASGVVFDGPNPFMVDIPKGSDESWDATEAALAKALERSASR